MNRSLAPLALLFALAAGCAANPPAASGDEDPGSDAITSARARVQWSGSGDMQVSGTPTAGQGVAFTYDRSRIFALADRADGTWLDRCGGANTWSIRMWFNFDNTHLRYFTTIGRTDATRSQDRTVTITAPTDARRLVLYAELTDDPNNPDPDCTVRDDNGGANYVVSFGGSTGGDRTVTVAIDDMHHISVTGAGVQPGDHVQSGGSYSGPYIDWQDRPIRVAIDRRSLCSGGDYAASVELEWKYFANGALVGTYTRYPADGPPQLMPIDPNNRDEGSALTIDGVRRPATPGIDTVQLIFTGYRNADGTGGRCGDPEVINVH